MASAASFDTWTRAFGETKSAQTTMTAAGARTARYHRPGPDVASQPQYAAAARAPSSTTKNRMARLTPLTA
jgi:hypothetical protein